MITKAIKRGRLLTDRERETERAEYTEAAQREIKEMGKREAPHVNPCLKYGCGELTALET